jgi:hypothetical protein
VPGGRRAAEDLELVTQHQDLDVLAEFVLPPKTHQFDRPTDNQEEEREGHGENIAEVLVLVNPR